MSLCLLELRPDVLFAWMYADAFEHEMSKELGHPEWEGLLNMAEVLIHQGFVRVCKELPVISSLGDEREREFGWFSLWLGAVSPQPEEPILVLLAFVPAALHEGEEQYLLLFRMLSLDTWLTSRAPLL